MLEECPRCQNNGVIVSHHGHFRENPKLPPGMFFIHSVALFIYEVHRSNSSFAHLIVNSISVKYCIFYRNHIVKSSRYLK